MSASPAALEAHIAELYRKQLALRPDPYLAEHAGNRSVLRRHLQAIARYQPFLGQKILDWGSRHAVDSCAIRFLRGDGVQLFACDVEPPGRYEAFSAAGRFQYTQLTHDWLLPYADQTFDTVVGSGVLEHVPNDRESLKELARVVKPGGRLIVTFLPNHWSYTEAIRRRTGGRHHDRLYSIRMIRQMFGKAGFMPLAWGYHQVLPTLAGGGKFGKTLGKIAAAAFGFNGILERIPLVKQFASNIYIIGERREHS